MFETRWHYGWNVVATSIVFQAISFGIYIYSFAFWVLPWMEEFGASRRDVMIAIMIGNLAMGFSAPFIGRALDRKPIRLLVILGTCIFSVSLVLISFATALWQIALVYGLFLSIGSSLAGPLAAQTLAAKWFVRRQGFAIGISALGTSLGGFLVPPIATNLMDAYGWRATFVILAIASVVIIVPLVWLVLGREPQPRQEDRKQQPTGETAPVLKNWTTTELLRSRALWVVIGSFIPMVTIFSAVQFNLGAYAKDLGIGIKEASYLMSALSVAMIGGKLFFGIFSDRLDHRYLYWIANGAMLASVTLLYNPGGYYVLLAAVVFLGLGGGSFIPVQGAIVASRFGGHAFGQVSGLIGPFMTVNAVGSLIAGWVRDASGSYEPVFLGCFFLIIPAVVIMYFLPPVPNAPGTETEKGRETAEPKDVAPRPTAAG